MTRKPKKKNMNIIDKYGSRSCQNYLNGYNQACDNWESYLKAQAVLKRPTEGEIEYIINDNVIPMTVRSKNECMVYVDKLAEAISAIIPQQPIKRPTEAVIAFGIKNANLPFFECIAKERRDEAYYDIAEVILKLIPPERPKEE